MGYNDLCKSGKAFVSVHVLIPIPCSQGLNVNARQEKIIRSGCDKIGFNSIGMSRFLDRSLGDEIIGIHKPDGLLLCRSFMREKAAA
ncbi:MAG TPA: hypothetical protein VIF10_14600 [Methylobacter sp.]|jgi:hypothetical protein